MLITSRETGRWIIPKGWPNAKLRPWQIAEQEAYEEAGLVGKVISKEPVGSYHYQKRLASGAIVACEVKVFLLAVERQLEAWPEKDQRETRWFDPGVASSLVPESDLAHLICEVSSNMHGNYASSVRRFRPRSIRTKPAGKARKAFGAASTRPAPAGA